MLSDPPSSTKRLYILRRKQGGFGGAEKVVKKFAAGFEGDWETVVVSEGSTVEGHAIKSLKGPNWFRAKQYSERVDQLTASKPAELIFSLERGPRCDIYRAGDGVHKRWIELRHGKSMQWMFNPWHWMGPILEKKTLSSTQVIVANSNMVKDDIARFYPAFKDKVTVIYNGFDPNQFCPATEPKKNIRKTLGLNLESKILLFCGSGWERKGLSESLIFLAEVRKKHPGINAQLVVIGQGKPHKYENIIEQLGLQKQVIFKAPVDNVAPYYQAANALILPTAYDPFSNACLEALACDCPVITTCQNGVAEVINYKRTGYILKNRKPSALAEAADWWGEFEPTPGLAAETVQHLTKENELAQLRAIFERLVSQ